MLLIFSLGLCDDFSLLLLVVVCHTTTATASYRRLAAAEEEEQETSDYNDNPFRDYDVSTNPTSVRYHTCVEVPLLPGDGQTQEDVVYRTNDGTTFSGAVGFVSYLVCPRSSQEDDDDDGETTPYQASLKDPSCNSCDHDEIEFVTGLNRFVAAATDTLSDFCNECLNQCSRRRHHLYRHRRLEQIDENRLVDCSSCMGMCSEFLDAYELNASMQTCQYIGQTNDSNGNKQYMGLRCVRGKIVHGLFWDDACRYPVPHSVDSAFDSLDATIRTACMDVTNYGGTDSLVTQWGYVMMVSVQCCNGEDVQSTGSHVCSHFLPKTPTNRTGRTLVLLWTAGTLLLLLAGWWTCHCYCRRQHQLNQPLVATTTAKPILDRTID